jgi:hypothetical protein
VPKRPIVNVTGVLSADADPDGLATAVDEVVPVSDAFGVDVPLDDEQPASATAATTAAPTSACRFFRAMNMDPPVSPPRRGSGQKNADG